MSIKVLIVRSIASMSLVVAAGAAFTAPASATFTCNQDSGICTDDSTVQTPLGLVDISVSAANVVTVHLSPIYPRTQVQGVAQSYPPGPPARSGYTRTSVETIGGTVNIDTSQAGPENVAIISIHPPVPIRASTTGNTVVFTPVYPPGPPT